jgi:Flp pilus assembly protein TadG
MKSNKKRQLGNALVEFALVFQLMLVLLLSSFNIGVYAYGLIAVQNAARTAALRNSGGAETAADQAGACAMAIRELRGLPNIGPAFAGSCSSGPLIVSSTGCDGTIACPSGTTSADGAPAAFVRVTYTLPQLFQFPAESAKTITRTSEMRIRSIE